MATSDDKLKILEEKVNALPEEARADLTIKIKHKDSSQPGATFVPKLVCTMGGAHITHVVNPELWLPQLMGGGRFELDVYLPGNNASPAAAGFVYELQGETRAFPDHDAVDAPHWKGPKKITYPMRPAAPKSSSPTTFIASPQGTTPSTTAPQTVSPGTGSPGGMPPAMIEELRRLQDQYQQQLAAFQAQQQQLQNQLAEERHKREVEAIRAQQQNELNAIRAEMERLKTVAAAPPAPPPPAKSFAEVLKDVIPAASPLVTAFLQMQMEERRRAEERHTQMLQAMQSKPAIDPAIEKLMERFAADQQPASILVQQSAQATATMAAQMMTMVQTMAEALQGPEESPVLKAVREVGGTIKDIVAAGAQQVNQPRPRRLPRPEASPQTGLHGYDPAASPPSQLQNTLARIREMLLAHEDPDKIAQAAVQAFPTAEFQKALRASGMDANRMFEALMTTEWVTANSAYAIAFGQAFMKHAALAGIVGDDPEETDDEADAA